MSVRGAAPLALALGLLAGLAARPAAAQQVTFVGRGDPDIDRRISGILGGGYTLFARDTTIGARDTVRGPVLALGIRLRLNGTVTGDLVGVASNLFVHPSAVVTGDVVNAGGGLYASSLAHVGTVVDQPLVRYDVARSGDTIRIQGFHQHRSPVVPDAWKGVDIPIYDRVDGLWLQAGAALRLPAPPALDSARLHVVGGWRTGGPGGSYTIDLQARRGRYTAAVGGQRLTSTADRWVRGDVVNSLAFLAAGNDSRDYYDAQRLFALLAWDLVEERWSGYLAVRGLREDADSLRTRDPFVIHKPHALRPNPRMFRRIASVGAQAAVTWTGNTDVVGLYGEVEKAASVLGGDFAFARYALEGHAAVEALWGHLLTVEARVQGPLPGSDPLPRQRWSHVGGPATLPTFPIDAFVGDHVMFLSEQYVIPLMMFKTPFGAAPELALVHAAGKAWVTTIPVIPGGSGAAEATTRDRTLEQNLGVELRLFGLALSAYADPAHARSTARFGAGFSLGLGRLSGLPPRFDMTEAER